MAISYPLDTPDNLGLKKPRSVNMRPKSTTSVFKSPYSAVEQTQSFPAQWWEMEVELPPMHREDMSQWIAYLLSLHGRKGTFNMGVSSAEVPLGNNPASATVNSIEASLEGLTIDTSNNNKLDVIKAGDYFRIDNVLYMALNKSNTNSFGVTSSINTFPKVHKSVSVGESVFFSSLAYCSWRLLSDQFDYSIDRAAIYGLKFSATSVVP